VTAVDDVLDSFPTDTRASLSAVREAILQNLPKPKTHGRKVARSAATKRADTTTAPKKRAKPRANPR